MERNCLWASPLSVTVTSRDVTCEERFFDRPMPGSAGEWKEKCPILSISANNFRGGTRILSDTFMNLIRVNTSASKGQKEKKFLLGYFSFTARVILFGKVSRFSSFHFWKMVENTTDCVEFGTTFVV